MQPFCGSIESNRDKSKDTQACPSATCGSVKALYWAIRAPEFSKAHSLLLDMYVNKRCGPQDLKTHLVTWSSFPRALVTPHLEIYLLLYKAIVQLFLGMCFGFHAS